MTVKTSIIVIILNVTQKNEIKRWHPKLIDLDSALWRRITQIVQTDNRPFSSRDFVFSIVAITSLSPTTKFIEASFLIDGKCYSISPGTARNKLSSLLKAEKIEVAYYSSQAFYTIKGIRFDKSMSEDHIGVVLPLPLRRIKNDPIYRSIQGLRFAQRGLHNISLADFFVWKVNFHLSTHITCRCSENHI